MLLLVIQLNGLENVVKYYECLGKNLNRFRSVFIFIILLLLSFNFIPHFLFVKLYNILVRILFPFLQFQFDFSFVLFSDFCSLFICVSYSLTHIHIRTAKKLHHFQWKQITLNRERNKERKKKRKEEKTTVQKW